MAGVSIVVSSSPARASAAARSRDLPRGVSSISRDSNAFASKSAATVEASSEEVPVVEYDSEPHSKSKSSPRSIAS